MQLLWVAAMEYIVVAFKIILKNIEMILNLIGPNF